MLSALFATFLTVLPAAQTTHAAVRAIYNADRHWLVLLMDYVDPKTKAGDGKVDEVYRFVGINGTWPLGARWEGIADVDTYAQIDGRPGGLGIHAGGRFVQVFLSLPDDKRTFGRDVNGDARATQLTVRDAGHASGGSGVSTVSFADAEHREVEAVEREAASYEPAAPTPVRVGSRILQPRKISGDAPIRPAGAAHVRGMVVLEIVVGVDGTVTSANVLRSVPSLDQAALAAVRTWRYEPTRINDELVPVILTVAVTFR